MGEEMYASKKKIEWLLFDSGLQPKEIHEKSGVALTTVHDLWSKKANIDMTRFVNATKLTKCSEEIQKEKLGK